MGIDYYSAFFADKPELEMTLKEFGEKFSIPVMRRLKAVKDRDEFLSEIIEYRSSPLRHPAPSISTYQKI